MCAIGKGWGGGHQISLVDDGLPGNTVNVLPSSSLA